MKVHDEFNMSMRKFLKQVGVTSQQAIEKGCPGGRSLRRKKTFKVKAVITIEELGLDHVVTGEIQGHD
ncbi:DUF6494 family protein [Roseibium salinum]|nr:DUF6494 family protein [Roseibium salinum]